MRGALAVFLLGCSHPPSHQATFDRPSAVSGDDVLGRLPPSCAQLLRASDCKDGYVVAPNECLPAACEDLCEATNCRFGGQVLSESVCDWDPQPTNLNAIRCGPPNYGCPE
jgi:hypothetical protein